MNCSKRTCISSRASVTGMDLEVADSFTRRTRKQLNYDVLVLALGGITNYVGVEGAEEFSLPFRKLEPCGQSAATNGGRARSHSARHGAAGCSA